MHIAHVVRGIAVILLIVSFFMVFPILFAVYYDEVGLIRYFLYTMGGTTLVSGAVLFLVRSPRFSLTTRDGFLFVSGGWMASALVGAFPMWLSGAVPSFTDAFFESMSGLTTTGASILTEIEALPKSILFWRSLTHWLGGMGIVVLTVAILPLLGIGAYQLIKAEAPGPTMDKITPRIAQTAKILWSLYVGLTVAETALLMIGGMNLFDALTHTFGTLATGGFSPKNLSVGHYDSAFIDAVITVFMIFAGLNFVLYYRLLRGHIKRVFSNVEMKAYIGIFFASTLIITLVLYNKTYDTIGESLRYAGFQAATILTTTGYVTTDYTAWPYLAQIVLFALMFIGGCSGSTGGGIKVIRIVTMAKLALNEMKYLSHPNSVFRIRIGKETIMKNVVYAITGFFFLYILVLVVTSVVVASAGVDIQTSFSTALVTVGNIGPGFGRVGPAGNYAFYPEYVKWFLSFAMMIGRLELYTVLVILTPKFWRT